MVLSGLTAVTIAAQHQILMRHRQAGERRYAGTYVGDAEEGEKEGCQDDDEGEELPVPVQQLELIDEPGDHRLHPAHLQATQGRGALGAGPALCTPPRPPFGQRNGRAQSGAARCPGCRIHSQQGLPWRRGHWRGRTWVDALSPGEDLPDGGGALRGPRNTVPCVATKAQLCWAFLSKCLPHKHSLVLLPGRTWRGHWPCPH